MQRKCTCGLLGRATSANKQNSRCFSQFYVLTCCSNFLSFGGISLSLSLCPHHGTYIFLFFFSSDVKSVYCVLLTTTQAPYPIFKFQKTAQGRSVGDFTISKTSQAGRTTTQPHLKDHTQFSRFSSILFAWKERLREKEIVHFSQTIICHSQVQFTTVYKVLIIFFFFFSFRNTATTTTTTST